MTVSDIWRLPETRKSSNNPTLPSLHNIIVYPFLSFTYSSSLSLAPVLPIPSLPPVYYVASSKAAAAPDSCPQPFLLQASQLVRESAPVYFLRLAVFATLSRERGGQRLLHHSLTQSCQSSLMVVSSVLPLTFTPTRSISKQEKEGTAADPCRLLPFRPPQQQHDIRVTSI